MLFLIIALLVLSMLVVSAMVYVLNTNYTSPITLSSVPICYVYPHCKLSAPNFESVVLSYLDARHGWSGYQSSQRDLESFLKIDEAAWIDDLPSYEYDFSSEKQYKNEVVKAGLVYSGLDLAQKDETNPVTRQEIKKLMKRSGCYNYARAQRGKNSKTKSYFKPWQQN